MKTNASQRPPVQEHAFKEALAKAWAAPAARAREDSPREVTADDCRATIERLPVSARLKHRAEDHLEDLSRAASAGPSDRAAVRALVAAMPALEETVFAEHILSGVGRSGIPRQPGRASGMTRGPVQMLKLFGSDNKILADALETEGAAWEPHIANSRAAILSAARGLGGTALVLGLGNGMDEPLEALATQFDKVIAVDLNLEGMKMRQGQLPDDLRKKCELRQGDLSGVLGYFSERADAVLSGERSRLESGLTDLLASVSRMAEAATVPVLEGLKADFICSSLVLSQLPYFFQRYIEDRLEEREPLLGARLIYGSEAVRSAIMGLGLTLQKKHAEALRQAVKPSGRVYFSDTFAQVPRGGRPLPMLAERHLLRELGERFELAPVERWKWARAPQVSFNVEARTLTPRSG